MDAVATLKEKGNTAVSRKDYKGAISFYTKALELQPNSQCFSNRSLCHYMLKDFKAALFDADECVKLSPGWAKGYYRRSVALLALDEFSSAIDAARHALTIEPNTSDFKYLISDAEKNRTEKYFVTKTKVLSVNVKWMSSERGRGVVASRNFAADEIVFEELPLASQRTPEENPRTRLDACNQCMKTILRADNLSPLFTDIIAQITPAHSHWIACDGCDHNSVRFCSEACRAEAQATWHSPLCGCNVAQAGCEALMKSIYDRSRADSKTNPLLVLKMMAIVYQNISSKLVHVDDAWLPFRTFSSYSDPSDPAAFLEREVVELAQRLFTNEKAASNVATIENFRYLHGVITRNAQHLLPVSDFHLFMNSASPNMQTKIICKLDPQMSPLDFVQSRFMNDLCIQGTGLYAVANMMNHSCAPNVMTVCSSNCDKITVIALRPIRQGEELCISYIDENAPFSERQRKLSTFYSFECRCKKCLERK